MCLTASCRCQRTLAVLFSSLDLDTELSVSSTPKDLGPNPTRCEYGLEKIVGAEVTGRSDSGCRCRNESGIQPRVTYHPQQHPLAAYGAMDRVLLIPQRFFLVLVRSRCLIRQGWAATGEGYVREQRAAGCAALAELAACLPACLPGHPPVCCCCCTHPCPYTCTCIHGVGP